MVRYVRGVGIVEEEKRDSEINIINKIILVINFLK